MDMILSLCILMYNALGRIRRNMNVIAMEEFYRFAMSSVLETTQNGVRYHQEAGPRLKHPTKG